MSSTEADAPRSAGRPAGQAPETLAKAARYRDAVDLGATPRSIARAEGVDERNVRRLLALTSSLDGGRPAVIPTTSLPKPPRRISEAALCLRTVALINQRGALQLVDAETRLFWQAAVLEIRNRGNDGQSLRYAETGYRTPDRFVQAMWATREQLDSLIECGLLVDLDGAGLGIPLGFGLIRGEKAGHAPHADQPRDPHHSATIHQMPGTVRENQSAPPPPPYRQEKSPSCEPAADPISSPPGGQEMGVSCPQPGQKTPISCPDASRAATATADALREEIQDSSDSISTGIVAEPADNKSPISCPAGGQEIPPGHDIKPERFSLAETANRLSVLAGRGPVANAADLGTVDGWLSQCADAGLADAGVAEAMIAAVIAIKLPKMKERLSAMSYLSGAVGDALTARGKAAQASEPREAPPSAAPLPPLPEDTEFSGLFGSITRAWMLDTMLPAPPTEPRFRAACEAGDGVVAHRWPELWDAWDRAGRPGKLKPPAFADLFTMREAFLTDVMEIEAELIRRCHGPDGPG